MLAIFIQNEIEIKNKKRYQRYVSWHNLEIIPIVCWELKEMFSNLPLFFFSPFMCSNSWSRHTHEFIYLPVDTITHGFHFHDFLDWDLLLTIKQINPLRVPNGKVKVIILKILRTPYRSEISVTGIYDEFIRAKAYIHFVFFSYFVTWLTATHHLIWTCNVLCD